jgi:hypothetical protein
MNTATLNQAFNMFPRAGVGIDVERYKGYERIYQPHPLENQGKTTQNKLVSGIPNDNNVRNDNTVNFRYEAKLTANQVIAQIIAQIKDLTAKEIVSNYFQSILKIQNLTNQHLCIPEHTDE